MSRREKGTGGMAALWMQRWCIVLAGFFLSVMIPYMSTLLWSGQVAVRNGELSYSGDLVVAEGKEMDAENFLILVLARQIDGSAPPGAKEAQAVAARTNLYKTMEEAQCNQADDLGIEYDSLSEMKNRWGEEFSQIYQSYEAAVSATAGEVLTCDGQLIDALFHKASAGNTRTMGEEYPWLVSVESDDQLCDGYLTVTDFSPEKFAEAVNAVDGARQVSAEEIAGKIQIINRADGAYVTAVQVDQQIFSGEEMAAALQLNSTAFSFEADSERVRVICTGIGHGWGLSQTGAARMAEEGKSRQEILGYYYPGTEVTEKY